MLIPPVLHVPGNGFQIRCSITFAGTEMTLTSLELLWPSLRKE